MLLRPLQSRVSSVLSALFTFSGMFCTPVVSSHLRKPDSPSSAKILMPSFHVARPPQHAVVSHAAFAGKLQRLNEHRVGNPRREIDERLAGHCRRIEEVLHRPLGANRLPHP